MVKKAVFLFAALMLITTVTLAEDGSILVKVAPVPPNLSASVQFTEPSGNKILDAEETGKLIITLQNRGKGDAFDVRAEIKASGKTGGLEFTATSSLGRYPPEGR